MIIHYYQQFFTGPNAPGTLTPRKLMQHLAGQGHTVHVVATDFNVYNEQTEPPEDYALPSGGRSFDPPEDRSSSKISCRVFST